MLLAMMNRRQLAKQNKKGLHPSQLSQATAASTQVTHSHSTNVARATTTHQTTVKAETVAMMVVGMTTAVERTTAATPGTTTAETTVIIAAITTVAGLI